MTTTTTLLVLMTLFTSDVEPNAAVELPTDGRVVGVLIVIADEAVGDPQQGLSALARMASGRGFVVVVARSTCEDAAVVERALDGWLDDFGRDALGASSRHVIGIGACATFLVRGIEAGRLARFTRIGVVDALPLSSTPVRAAHSARGVRVFVEANRRARAAADADELAQRLAHHVHAAVNARSVRAAADFDDDRAARFYAWFAGDQEVQLAQPRVRPP